MESQNDFFVLEPDNDEFLDAGAERRDDSAEDDDKMSAELSQKRAQKRNMKPKPAIKSADNRAHISRQNWTDGFSAALIAQVELLPAIWDVHSADFRSKHLKDAAWTKVRTECNLTHIPDAECRRKWQNLCSNNNKLANVYYTAVSGQAAKKTPDWMHWSAMEFVRKNKASYKTSSQSNLEGDETDSQPQCERSNDGKAKRMKRQASSTPTSTETSATLEKLDAIVGKLGQYHSNPNSAMLKGWAAMLDGMLPMYATRAKCEIKATLTKYMQLSVMEEEQVAEKQFQLELAKASMCTTLEIEE